MVGILSFLKHSEREAGRHAHINIPTSERVKGGKPASKADVQRRR